MKRYYKPAGMLAAAAMTAAVFATSDRLPAQSTTDSQPSAESSADDAFEVTVVQTAESQARKLKETKTLDQVRKLNNYTFMDVVIAYGPKGDVEASGSATRRKAIPEDMPGMGMGGGMPGGGMIPGGMGGMPQPGPREQAMNKINGLQKKLKAASEEDQRKIAEQLRAALADYFLIDMQLRVKELDEIKARVERMEAKLQKRLDSREESVDLQLKLFLRDAEGLGFFRSEDSLPK